MRLVALVLLALGVPALAADSCLTGAATLGDQRALATLRADVETACPCAAATSRRAWQDCARNTLRQALAAGSLRAECRRTAMTVNRGATCGSARIACGRVRSGARMPVSCRVRPAARCTDGRVEATVCTAETHCADVVEWTAGTCVDPRVAGPQVPGVRVVHLEKPSVVDPTQTRVLDVVVWYPAPPGAGTPAGPYAAVENAPVDPSAGPYPLLVFSHGSCGYPAQSTFMTSLLASHGFIVAAPPHPGNTIGQFPACGSPANQLASAQERPADVIFTLDSLLAADQDPASPFHQAIDETRLGMSGHSFGGLTTFLVQPAEPRFRVAMPLAAATGGQHALTVPSLVMLGQIDSVVDNDAIRSSFANGVQPKLLVEIANAGHYAFSNGCFAGPDCDPPTTLTQGEAHSAVLRWVLPFLEVHLAGDETFRPFLGAPLPTGVSVTSAR